MPADDRRKAKGSKERAEMKEFWDVAIIGGGVGGLSAARKCAKAGLKTILFEADRIGGRAGSVNRKKYIIDMGAVYIMIPGKHFMNATKELGLEDRRIEVNKKITYRAQGEWHELDFSSYLALIKSMSRFRLIPLRTKADPRVVKFLLNCVRVIREFKEDYRSIRKYEDKSAKEVLLNYFDEKTCETVFEPLAETFLFSRLEETSAGAFMGAIGCFMDQANKIYYFKKGTGELADAMEKDLKGSTVKIRREKITKVSRKEDGFELAAADGKTIRSKTAICAIPLPYLSQIYPGLPEEYLKKINKIQYPSIISVFCGLKEPVKTFGESHIACIPEEESESIRFISENTNKSDKLVPDGKGLLHIFIPPSKSKTLFKRPGKEISRMVKKELERLLPGIGKTIEFVEIIRWKHGLRAPTLGSFRLEIEEGTPVKGLFICGDSIMLGLDAVINSGETAAELAGKELKAGL